MKVILKVKIPNPVFHSGLQLVIHNRQQYNLFAANEYTGWGKVTSLHFKVKNK